MLFNRIQILFWLLFSSVSATVLCIVLDKTSIVNNFGNFIIEHAPFSIFLALVLAGLVIYLFHPVRELKRQKVYNQPSWVFYAYFDLLLVPILLDIYRPIVSMGLHFKLAYYFGLLAVGYLFYDLFKKGVSEEEKRFAAGSVDSFNDKLGFKISAKNVCSGLSNISDYVSVVGLYGDLGSGKSSYARMIIENFDDKKTLYTYISLTETNEAKDFSKLFAERWYETLSSRYPKISIDTYLPMMRVVLRESGNGIFSGFLRCISSLDKGLISTMQKHCDTYYKRKYFVSEDVAKVFGNVVEIFEDRWIIMVDEIERAQFDEIYRLVEVIERFKNEGRSGLPTKVMFILCIAPTELQKLLSTFRDKDNRAYLLEKFFWENPKSVTHTIFLPPVDIQKKMEFVKKRAEEVRLREHIDDGLSIEQTDPNTIYDPADKFLDKKQALDYALGYLLTETPRMIDRCFLQSLPLFYSTFRTEAGELRKDAIRYSDLIIAEYIKIKFPYLIDFFVKTIGAIVYQREKHNLESYHLQQKLKEKKMSITDWIESVTEETLNEKQKEDVSSLIGLVAHSYIDFMRYDYDTDHKVDYYGTLSYPEELKDYLTLVSGDSKTVYRKNHELFIKHKNNTLSIKDLSDEDLVVYSRFLTKVYERKQRLCLDVLSEITDRLVFKKIKIQPGNLRDTIYDEYVYQFVFQLLAIAEDDHSQAVEPSKEIIEAYDCLKKYLESPAVSTQGKYTVLNSFANNKRGGDVTGIHGQLERAFEKILGYFKNDILRLVELVFKEADERYFSGDDVIYAKEENYFYLLYQSWSGSKDDEDEIKIIRSVARRGLEQHPEAIALFWVNYGNYNTPDEFFADHVRSIRFEKNSQIYMTLEDLIEITKHAEVKDPVVQEKVRVWKKIVKDGRYNKQEFLSFHNDETTLKAVLLERGFLQKK